MSYPAPPAWSTHVLPQYDIGFGAAVKRGYQNYATFTGRASRREFWFFYLFVVVTTMILVFAGIGLGLATSPDNGDNPGIPGIVLLALAGVLYLGSLVPLISASGRRLHDAGYSALLCLLFLASLGIVVLVLAIMPTSRNGDQYGPSAPAYHPAGGYAPVEGPPAPGDPQNPYPQYSAGPNPPQYRGE